MRTRYRMAAATMLLAINTVAAGGSARLGRQSDATVLNTPDEGTTLRPMKCRTPPVDEAASLVLEHRAQDGGSERRRAEAGREAAPPRHTFPEWEALACELLRQKRITPEQYVTLVDNTLPLLAPSAALPRPELFDPKSGAVFDHYPRRTIVSWKRVTDAAQYLIEVQYVKMHLERAADGSIRLKDTGWAPHNDGLQSAVVSGESAIFHFVGAQRGRVRVRAIAENGEVGPPSSWRNFRFTR